MIQTNRLVLRGFVPEDWDALWEYLSQEETVRFEPYEVFSQEEAKREAAARAENPDFWAVCLQSTGRLIGNLYLSPGEFDCWELGYVFHSGFLGQGYATEAARALVDDAFQNRGAHRVTALCDPLNRASWKLLERLSLRREGTLLQNVWFCRDEKGNPLWKDTYAYAVLKEEWQKKKESTPCGT